jgi:hypothetical protein
VLTHAAVAVGAPEVVVLVDEFGIVVEVVVDVVPDLVATLRALGVEEHAARSSAPATRSDASETIRRPRRASRRSLRFIADAYQLREQSA